ncbi:hypothetical protein [Tahibacter caeni]|nr:hypothetical protein [Tahibacter caeni]
MIWNMEVPRPVCVLAERRDRFQPDGVSAAVAQAYGDGDAVRGGRP